MSGKDECSLLALDVLQDTPNSSSSDWVHTRGGLIQEHNLGFTYEGHTKREFTFVASTELLGEFMLFGSKAALLKDILHFCLQLLTFKTFHPSIVPKVLLHCQVIVEHVSLHTNTRGLPNFIEVLINRLPVEPDCSSVLLN